MTPPDALAALIAEVREKVERYERSKDTLNAMTRSHARMMLPSDPGTIGAWEVAKTALADAACEAAPILADAVEALGAWRCVGCGARFAEAFTGPGGLDGVEWCSSCAKAQALGGRVKALTVAIEARDAEIAALRENAAFGRLQARDERIIRAWMARHGGDHEESETLKLWGLLEDMLIADNERRAAARALLTPGGS